MSVDYSLLPCSDHEIVFLQCTPEQISKDLHDELMCQLDHDDNLHKVSHLSGVHTCLPACSTLGCHQTCISSRSWWNVTNCPSSSLKRRYCPPSTVTLWCSSEEQQAVEKPPKFLSLSWTVSSKVAERLTATLLSPR